MTLQVGHTWMIDGFRGGITSKGLGDAWGLICIKIPLLGGNETFLTWVISWKSWLTPGNMFLLSIPRVLVFCLGSGFTTQDSGVHADHQNGSQHQFPFWLSPHEIFFLTETLKPHLDEVSPIWLGGLEQGISDTASCIPKNFRPFWLASWVAEILRHPWGKVLRFEVKPYFSMGTWQSKSRTLPVNTKNSS